VIAVNVAGLLREPPGATREYRLPSEAANLAPDVDLGGPVEVTLRLQRTNRGILLRGSASATVDRTCARCTDPYSEAVTVELEEEYLPSVDPLSGAPLRTSEVDARRIDAHQVIDLEPLLREEFTLAEPMHPLCTPDCAGLCPGCGRRLAVGSCDCDVAEVDPRLAGLARFRPAGGRRD